jgi:hypothetical protein
LFTSGDASSTLNKNPSWPWSCSMANEDENKHHNWHSQFCSCQNYQSTIYNTPEAGRYGTNFRSQEAIPQSFLNLDVRSSTLSVLQLSKITNR